MHTPKPTPSNSLEVWQMIARAHQLSHHGTQECPTHTVTYRRKDKPAFNMDQVEGCVRCRRLDSELIQAAKWLDGSPPTVERVKITDGWLPF